jgi:hypothetical protein
VEKELSRLCFFSVCFDEKRTAIWTQTAHNSLALRISYLRRLKELKEKHVKPWMMGNKLPVMI